MLRFRPLIGALAVLAVLSTPAVVVHAQGVTTGALTGTVSDSTGTAIENATVQLKNPLTGYTVTAQTRASGLYVIQGIEPNPNYTITVRSIGFGAVTRDGIVVSLGQTRREDFRLARQATQLTEVTVTATTYDAVINTSKTGASTTISDSALRRLPTLNRNFADFVSTVPQVSTTTGFLSGGGVNLRQNSIQIDGAQAGDLFGLGTTGQAGASANAKSIPLDAVKEYQVLLSPFDVRQGSFGGLLINAVTKGGTNEFHGGAYAYTRNQELTRKQDYLTDFSQQQYGASLGGRIIKDKVFFFVNGEAQQAQTPASGSYFGGSGITTRPYVSQAQIDQLQTSLNKYGFPGSVGTGEQIQRDNPLQNIFARIDANLPFGTRLILRHNYAKADNAVFSRSGATGTNPFFNLTSNGYDLSNKTHSSVIELLSNFSNGVYNEFLANYSTTKDFRTVPVRFPAITVQGIPRVDTTGTATFVVGTEASSQGNSLDQRTIEFTENLTIPVNNHSFTVGGKALLYRSINLFAQNSIGSWRFSSLADLEAGNPNQYIISAPAPTDPYNGLATIKAATYTWYVSDTWTPMPTLALNFGVRWDRPKYDNLPPYNASVDASYGRQTNLVPTNTQVSPRFGFNWDVTGDKRNQLRGGVGSFSGPTPFVYISNVFGNSGLSGYSSITCNATTAPATGPSLIVPKFTAQSAANPPLACEAGTRPNGTAAPGAAISGPAAGAAVNTIDPDFKNPKYLKASLGFDHRFGNGWVATLEGLYTRSQNNAFYQNLALAPGNQGLGINGRMLYGTFTAGGAIPTTIGSRQAVLDVTNASGDYTYNITAQLQKSFTKNFDASAAYTYQQSRDVVSITSSTAGSNFRYQRDVSGDIRSRERGVSKYDQPHRIIATGSYRFKTFTDVSVIYSGNSGAPFDFVYGSNGGTLGDLNADGQSQNDLMYVPRSALNQDEILFTGFNSTTAATRDNATAMAVAFEKLISDNDCLNSQRGRIMTRNSCRNPWTNRLDISVAQSLGKFGGRMFQNVQARLDVINFTNLLNKEWGEQPFSDQNSTCGQICSATAALVHTGNLLPVGLPAGTTTAQSARGIFTYSPTYRIFNADNASSNYRMQVSLRYSF